LSSVRKEETGGVKEGGGIHSLFKKGKKTIRKSKPGAIVDEKRKEGWAY